MNIIAINRLFSVHFYDYLNKDKRIVIPPFGKLFIPNSAINDNTRVIIMHDFDIIRVRFDLFYVFTRSKKFKPGDAKDLMIYLNYKNIKDVDSEDIRIAAKKMARKINARFGQWKRYNTK